MGLDINKFSWPQLFSNNDGKTSGSGFLGVIIGITGCLAFLAGVVDTMFITKGQIVINAAVTVIGIAAAMITARKYITKGETIVSGEDDSKESTQGSQE